MEALGSGVSSTVYRGTSLDDPSKTVAIKLSRANWNQTELEARVRFELEADLLSQLSHPNIVRLVCYGLYEDHLYLITELAKGKTLKQFIAERTLLTHLEVADILRQIALGLAHAHGKRILHRDVKPSNVVLNHQPGKIDVKVLDFGLSRFQDLRPTTQTVGSFLYMSPEQLGILPQAATERSDLYSLGILAIELLTGRHPFGDCDLRELIRRHAAVLPEIPSNVPEMLRNIIRLLVRKDPAERYNSAKGLAADLQKFIDRSNTADIQTAFELRGQDRSTELRIPAFLGRRAELDLLHTCFIEAGKGRLQLATLSGQSGMGKSRLIGEITRHWTSNLTLWGRGRAYGQASAYGLIAEALRGLTKQILSTEQKDKIKDACGELGGEILKLVPEMQRIIGDAKEPVQIEPERKQQRFLTLLTDIFAAIATPEAPLVFIFDDIQWSDEGSLQVILHLLKQADRIPGMMILAYRTDDAKWSERIENLVRQIAVSVRPTHIALRRLSDEDIKNLVWSMLGTGITEVSNVIASQANGSPLFAVELMHALVENHVIHRAESGWRLHDPKQLQSGKFSDGLLQTILNRLDRLNEGQRQVLTLAAVIGRSFDFDTLRNVTQAHFGESEEEAARRVLETLSEAEQSRLVASRPNEKNFSFTHDKIREAIYEGLDQKIRTHLHRLIGESLEKNARDTNKDVYLLAHHYLRSDEVLKGFDYSIEAGKLAQESYAHLEALDFFEQAQERIQKVQNAGAHPNLEARELHLSEMLADSYSMIGHYAKALDGFESILKKTQGDTAVARILRKKGKVLLAKGEASQAAENLERALRALGESVPTSRAGLLWTLLKALIVQTVHSTFQPKTLPTHDLRLREIAQIYTQLTYVYYFTDSVRSFTYHLRSLNFVESHNVIDEIGHAYSTHGPVMGMVPWFTRGIRYAQKSLILRQALGDRWGTAQSRHFLMLVMGNAGQWEEGIKVGRIAESEFQQLGDRWELVTLVVNIGYNYAYLGQWDLAESYAEKTLNISNEIHNTAGLAYSVWLKSEIGSKLDQEALLKEIDLHLVACLRAGDFFSSSMVYLAKGRTLLRLGRLQDSEKTFKEGLRVMHNRLLRTDYLMGMYPGRAEALLEQYDRTTSSKNRAILLRHIKKAIRAAKWATLGFPNHQPYTLRVQARYAWIKGDTYLAEKLWRKALNLSIEKHALYQQAQCLLDWGLALQEMDPDRSKNLLTQSIPIFKRLGATHHLRVLRSILPLDPAFTPEQTDYTVTTTNGFGNSSSDSSRNKVVEAERLSFLVDISRQLSATLDADGLLQKIVDAAARVFGAERAILYLREVSTEELHRRATFGAKEVRDCPVSTAVLDQILRSEKGVVFADAQLDPLLDKSESITSSGVRSVLAAPLLFQGKLLGILYLDNKLIRGLFHETDLETLEALASQAAVALQNAGSFSELAQSKNDLQELYKASQELMGVFDRRRIFAAIVNHAVHIARAEGAAVIAFETDKTQVKLQKGFPPYSLGELEELLAMKKDSLPLEESLLDGTTILAMPLSFANDSHGALVVSEPAEIERAKTVMQTLCSHCSLSLQNAKLFELAVTDELTQVYQRRHYETMLKDLSNKKEDFAVVLIDLNDFKPINDTLGHHMGDIALQHVGKTLQQNLRMSDLPARIGGDEFAVVLPGSNEEQTKKVVDKLRAAVSEIALDGKNGEKVYLSASFGFATSFEGELTTIQILADQRLYSDKYLHKAAKKAKQAA